MQQRRVDTVAVSYHSKYSRPQNPLCRFWCSRLPAMPPLYIALIFLLPLPDCFSPSSNPIPVVTRILPLRKTM
ncbi:hypothetical protein BDZ91DRAFT_726042, partial [Kalaharituber pfeilii]